ncbi:hypothetical protein [Streptomyces xanthophaeus]|uniref:hypothetical protein n=1 Tax=Streptomyces xanthophaeus TaxID=67385 RepID=UPI000A900CAF|nr:hypothetical protein [Streptomyces xanthophaeus]
MTTAVGPYGSVAERAQDLVTAEAGSGRSPPATSRPYKPWPEQQTTTLLASP